MRTIFSHISVIAFLLLTLAQTTASAKIPFFNTADSVSEAIVQKYVEVGSRRLNELIAQNEVNERKGESYKNSYVIDFAEALKVDNPSTVLEDYYYNRPSVGNKDFEVAVSIKANIDNHLRMLNATIIGNGRIYVGVNMFLGSLYFQREVKALTGTTAANNLDAFKIEDNQKNYNIAVAKYNEILTFINNEIIRKQGSLPKCVIFQYARYEQFLPPSFDKNDKKVWQSKMQGIYGITKHDVTVYDPKFDETLKNIPQQISKESLEKKLVSYTTKIADALREKPFGVEATHFLNYMIKTYRGMQEEKVMEIVRYINDHPQYYDIYISLKGEGDWPTGLVDNTQLGIWLDNYLANLKSTKSGDCMAANLELMMNDPANPLYTPQKLINALSCCYPWKTECFKSFSAQQKINLIKILCKETLNDYLPGFKTSDFVNIILKSAKDGDEKRLMLDLLANQKTIDNTPLLKKLSQDLYGLDGVNFEEFVTLLTNWIKTFKPGPNQLNFEYYQNAVGNGTVIVLNPCIFSGSSVSENYTTDGKILIRVSDQMKFLSPFEYVTVKFDACDFGEFKVGQVYTMPVIYLYMLLNSVNTKRLILAGRVSLDVALLFTGIGAIAEAKSAITLTKAILDIGIGATDIIVNTTLSDRINSSNNESAKIWLGRWNQISLVYGLGSGMADLGIAGANLIRNLRKDADAIQGLDNDIKILVEAETVKLEKRIFCFTAGTPVQTPDGVLAIESVKEGQKVYSYDESLQKKVVNTVKTTFSKTVDKIVKIFSGRETICTTEEHPFYTNTGWLSANGIRRGMRLLTMAGSILAVDSVASVDTTAQVYNFEVDQTHTYFVGKEGFLVHNKCTLDANVCKALTDRYKNLFVSGEEDLWKAFSQDVINDPNFKAYVEALPDDKIDDFVNSWKKAQRSGRINWVEVTDIRNKIYAKAGHVIENLDLNTAGTKFTGCHSEISLQNHVATNPTSRYEFRNVSYDVKSGIDDASRVFEAKPVVIKVDGSEIVKANNQGVSSFFPKNWDKNKILDEVEHAITNNYGRDLMSTNPREYFGFSRDGKVEIHFYYNTDGSIGSYFPKKR